MYATPRLERYGTFRSLTQLGSNANEDGLTITGIADGTGDNLCTAAEIIGFTCVT